MNKDDANAAVREFLLTEYRNFSESLWKNEQTGETRVNWFIGVASGALAGVIAMSSSEHRPHGRPAQLIVLSVLLALFSFGIVTLFRIIKRDKTTDGYKKDCDKVRELFKQHFDQQAMLEGYDPFKGPGKEPGQRQFGGLKDTVVGINSVLLAAIFGVLVYPFGQTPPDGWAAIGKVFAAAIVGFVISWLVQKRLYPDREVNDSQ
jgi:hypothetical protein